MLFVLYMLTIFSTDYNVIDTPDVVCSPLEPLSLHGHPISVGVTILHFFLSSSFFSTPLFIVLQLFLFFSFPYTFL
jgi:hypothetical protein